MSANCPDCLAPERDCVCEIYACGSCGKDFVMTQGALSVDSPTHSSFTCFICSQRANEYSLGIARCDVCSTNDVLSPAELSEKYAQGFIGVYEYVQLCSSCINEN